MPSTPQVSRGKGFHLVRGFPVEQFKDDRAGLVLAFWSLALHLGRPLVRCRGAKLRRPPLWLSCVTESACAALARARRSLVS